MRQYAVHHIPNKYVEWWLTKTGNRRSNHYLSGKSAEEHYPNVLQLPLGYMTGMLRSPIDNHQHHPSTAYTSWSMSVTTTRRKYKWAFIGTMKQDRSHAVTTFRSWTSAPHFLSNVTVDPWEMGQIYNNTVFVIVGRGWISLDCFRIYEAIIAGAIPLVVGEPDQISHLFHFNGNVMPLLTTDTWDKMLVICQNMTDEQVSGGYLSPCLSLLCTCLSPPYFSFLHVPSFISCFICTSLITHHYVQSLLLFARPYGLSAKTLVQMNRLIVNERNRRDGI